MSEVITIGEPLTTFASSEPDVPLVDVEKWHKIMGGAELNVAIGVQRLGHSTQYISRVGEDPFGEYIIKTINSHEVGTPALRSVAMAKRGSNGSGMPPHQSVPVLILA